VIDAIILSGGRGERLRGVLADRPKPLAEVGGRPFLAWLVLALANQGIRHIVLATGYLGDAIQGAMGDGRRFGVELTYSRESEPLGTGGAVRLAAPQVRTGRVLVLNGDSYCRFDLERLLRVQQQSKAAATMWLQEVPDPGRFGTVELGDDGRVVGFVEKAQKGREDLALISCGVYLMERSVLDRIPAKLAVSLERDVFPGLVGAELWGVRGEGIFVDIGTPQALAEADNLLQEELERLQTQRTQVEHGQAYLEESLAVQRRGFTACLRPLMRSADVITDALRAGGKVLLCGNGGSAADCQHMATELVGRLSKQLTRPGMAAIALTTDTSFLTAYANDVDFDGVFARQVEALGRPGDVLLGISTSGSSKNVLRAVHTARAQRLISIALVGEGGALADAVDHAIVIPDRDTQHIQETMLPLEHLLCLWIEDALHGSGAPANARP